LLFEGVVVGDELVILLFGLYFAAIALLAEAEVEVAAVVADPVALAQARERGGALVVARPGGTAEISHLNSTKFKFIIA
jgi:Ethanolamine utilization protein EutJ (predicted chaperonin)